jgi:hypothetical protein
MNGTNPAEFCRAPVGAGATRPMVYSRLPETRETKGVGGGERPRAGTTGSCQRACPGSHAASQERA